MFYILTGFMQSVSNIVKVKQEVYSHHLYIGFQEVYGFILLHHNLQNRSYDCGLSSYARYFTLEDSATRFPLAEKQSQSLL